MGLPPGYISLDLTDLVPLAVAEIKRDGIFWMPATRHLATMIHTAIRREMPTYILEMISLPPDWDHVIVDRTKHSEYEAWIQTHADHRFQLKERGVHDHQLPVKP